MNMKIKRMIEEHARGGVGADRAEEGDGDRRTEGRGEGERKGGQQVKQEEKGEMERFDWDMRSRRRDMEGWR